jgi:renalase
VGVPVPRSRILIVGAGLAGLVAASRLRAAGHDVTVVDKGRGVGGRLATRRIGDARLDHGAQFFTVRSEAFSALASPWLVDGVAREWCRGFGSPPDGHPRYVGATGMTDLAKAVAAGLEVRTSLRLASVGPGAGGGWSATLEDGSALTTVAGAVLEADAVVCTPPVPQTLDLLARGGVFLQNDVAGALAAIRYKATLAALVVLDGAPAVPAPGGVQLDRGPLTWVGDNHAKGISPVPALTLHAHGDLSAEHWADAPPTALGLVMEAGREWIGSALPVASELAKWRYAAPLVLHDERCLVAVDGVHPLVCAGDAFGEARVEGAACSGLAAAEAVLDRLA